MDVFLQQIVNSLVLAGGYTLVALGLYAVFGALHIPNFAHGEMFALGAYLQHTLVVTVGVAFAVAIVPVVLVVAAVGLVTERTIFRRLQAAGVTALLLGSLGLAIVLQELFGLLWGKDPLGVAAPLPAVLEIGPVRVAAYRVVIWVAVALVTVLLAFLLYRTRFGRHLRAMSQNPQLAALSGVATRRTGAITFAVGAGLAGLAGALLAPTASIHPHMGFQLTLVAFVVLVVVGAGARIAVVVAAGTLLALLETLAAGYLSNTLRLAVVFSILVVFLAVRPEGARAGPDATRARL